MPIWIKLGGRYHFTYLLTTDTDATLVNIAGTLTSIEKRDGTGKANWIHVSLDGEGGVVTMYGPTVMDAVEAGGGGDKDSEGGGEGDDVQ